MIQLQNLCLSFGTQKIFDSVSHLFNGEEKTGLIGLNGSGKSTLLKIIAKQQTFDDGVVKHSSGKKIGYMPQEVVLISTSSVIDEVVSSMEIYDETETESTRAEAKRMLMGLGFTIDQMEQSVSSLSVGWRMRVVLAKLLLQKADFYLFDEPTNHLDIVTKEWFLTFLQKAPFGFLLVCHERYFLDNLCTSIFELEFGKGTPYRGNYSSYLIQKEERRTALQSQYLQQQKEMTRKQATIDRFKASASKANMARSMQKALDKTDVIEMPPEHKRVAFKLPEFEPSGRTVVTASKLAHAFNTKKVFENISLAVEKHEKIAIIAANGVGKTTLLNVIMGKYNLQNGNVTMGHNVIPALFEQDQVTALDPNKTIFEIMQEAARNVTDLHIRCMLGSFLFSKDLIHKKAKVLSGGERNRLSMARVLLQKANLLILDEPTNHLDIVSKEILLDALIQYSGTILFVSHDQDFINKLATHIIELTPENAYKYEGNYESYLEQKEFTQSRDVREKPSKDDGDNSKSKSENPYERNKEIKRMESQIEKAEKEIGTLSLELGDYEYGTPEFSSRYEKVAQLQKKQETLTAAWEKLLQNNPD